MTSSSTDRFPHASALYDNPLPAARTGALYNAFSYPTKIAPEVIALFIATHTKPGDLVFDPFAGSGTTGVAAALCAHPSPKMVELAGRYGVDPQWGPRHAVLYELSTVGALLASVMCAPPEPAEFLKAAYTLLDSLAAEWKWIYRADHEEGLGTLRYAIWSELVVCHRCGAPSSYWDAAVRRHPLRLVEHFRCHSCARTVALGECERALETVVDPLTGTEVTRRQRRLAYVYGQSNARKWGRRPTAADAELAERIERVPVPAGTPMAQIQWGDLHRSGYHRGMSHLHHFYTSRNFLAMALVWERVERAPAHLRDALKLLALSFNAAHSTLMTRVVVKSGNRDFVVTGAQSGVLYVSGLPVEKNVFDGIRRKAKTLHDAFAAVHGSPSSVTVVNGSSTATQLGAASVDYVFTDPPFGGYIPYAEVNELNEAWLGRFTDRGEEAIISRHQGKGILEYAALMKRVFGEVVRVAKDGALATVVFHSSRPAVWDALGDALRGNGLEVLRSSVLDKVQPTFKQVVSAGGTRGDALFLLRKAESEYQAGLSPSSAREVVRLAREWFPEVTDPRRLFSLYASRSIERGQDVTVAASAFYEEMLTP